MASIGSYYITIMPDMSKFNGQIVSGLDGAGASSGKAFNGSFLSSIKGTALGVAVGNLVSSGFNQVMGGLSTGVERLDIIKNFPRVMANLGVDAGSAADAVDRIQRSLVGLPTSLQGGVQAVQRLTTSFGDVDRATDVFIAFNNALVAGAAPASLQASALEQFSQAVAKGKPDMLEWRSLMSAMPAQLEQVAQSMGMTSSQLGEGLRQGQIPMDDFLDSIIALNEEGVGEFGSFSEQVTAATSTIGTALTNVGNRIGAGWAAILDVFGQSNIADVINGFSTGVLDFMTRIGDALNWLKYTVLGTDIGESLASIGEQVQTWFGYFTEGLPSIKDVASAFIDFVDGALKWVADNGQIVAAALGAISGVLIALAAEKIVTGVLALKGAVSGFFAVLAANPFMAIVAAIAAVVMAIVTWLTQTEEGRAAWNKFTDAVGKAVDWLKDKFDAFKRKWGPIWDDIKKKVSDAWARIRATVEPIVAAIGKAVSDGWNRIRTTTETVFNAVRAVVEPIWNGIKAVIKGVVDFITSFVKGDFEGMKTAVGNIFTAIKDTATNVWNGIKSAISGPIEAAKTVVTNVINSVKSFLSNTFSAIKTNTTNIWNGIKSAITAPIDAARGVVQGAIGGIQGIINGLTGKKVDVGVNDSTGYVSGIVQRIQGSINSLYGRTVGINLHAYQTGVRTLDVATYSTNTGRVYRYSMVPTYMAAGGIATKATAAIFGEAGSEAVIPLSNRSKVRPFARAVASEMAPGGQSSSVNVTGNTFYVRNDADIDLIARRISLYQSRQMAGRL